MRQKASATNLAALFANKERNMAGFDLAKKALKRLGDSITAPQKAAQAAQAAQAQALAAASAKKQREQQAQAEYTAKLQRTARPTVGMKKGGAVKKKVAAKKTAARKSK